MILYVYRFATWSLPMKLIPVECHICNMSMLVQVMAQSHYLSQCWPRFMSPYGTNSHNDLKPMRVISSYSLIVNGECFGVGPYSVVRLRFVVFPWLSFLHRSVQDQVNTLCCTEVQKMKGHGFSFFIVVHIHFLSHIIPKVIPLGRYYIQHTRVTLKAVSWNPDSKWPKDLECQGQWPLYSTPVKRISRSIFGANLVILAQIHFKLLHGKDKFPTILSHNGQKWP